MKREQFTAKDMLEQLKRVNENGKEEQLGRVDRTLEELLSEVNASMHDFKRTKNTNLVRLSSFRNRVQSLENAVSELEALEKEKMALDRMDWALDREDEDNE